MSINEWTLLETSWHEGSYLPLLIRLATTDDH
jgi:hypothetical protein